MSKEKEILEKKINLWIKKFVNSLNYKLIDIIEKSNLSKINKIHFICINLITSFLCINYKYVYLKGSCDLYCTNNLRYSIKEWKTINCVPPLINCLENKTTFECQPSASQVIEYLDFAI